MPFSALVERVRSEDPVALAELLELYGDAIRREIRFALLDAKLRQFIGDSDVYQSVVIRFFSGMRDGDFEVKTPEDLMRLLKGIARTRIAELVRYWHAQKRDVRRNGQLSPSAADRAAANARRPLDTLEMTELLASVNGRLSDRDRDILQWRHEGRSWPQIAEKLGEPSGEAVRKSHERSLTAIQRELNDREASPRRK